DNAVFQDRRVEAQLHAKRLVLDGNGARPPYRRCRLAHRYRIFAAGEKRGGIAGKRDQVRLGQSADQSFRFQGTQEYIKGGTIAGKICQRNTERRSAGEQCACSCKYWKADCTAAGGRTGRGDRISACVNTRDGGAGAPLRPAPPFRGETPASPPVCPPPPPPRHPPPRRLGPH